jgi:hypothetical protein
MPISLGNILDRRPDVLVRVTPLSDLIHVDLMHPHDPARADLFGLREYGLEVFCLGSEQRVFIRATGLDRLEIAERISTHLEIEYRLHVQRLVPDSGSQSDPEIPAKPVQSFLFA